ncbi:MAG: ribosome biogenesis GTP-binding protein YihA/YsxC [Peptococcaceae bacterium]|nr:ribosome biogenesis GTP-binding protein YihA/YsxC [Peptococcaceae bacterium]
MKIVTAEFVKSAFSLKDCPAGKFPEIALAGRSNVGKSSLLNKVVNRKGLARTSNTPGRTRIINFFLINSASDGEHSPQGMCPYTFYLVDLPGYGYARVPERMKVEWGVLIRNYLENRKNLAAVVLILDIRHRPTDLDLQTYQWLQKERRPSILVATKADKLSKNQANNQIREIKKVLGLEAQKPLITFSAKTGQGREELLDLMEAVLIPNS